VVETATATGVVPPNFDETGLGLGV
jgi:hypothetical protein